MSVGCDEARRSGLAGAAIAWLSTTAVAFSALLASAASVETAGWTVSGDRFAMISGFSACGGEASAATGSSVSAAEPASVSALAGASFSRSASGAASLFATASARAGTGVATGEASSEKVISVGAASRT